MTLKVVVRPGFLQAAASGTPVGRQRELIQELGARLDLRVSWIEAGHQGAVLRTLTEGKADLAVWRLPPRPDLIGTVVPTAPLEWVDDVLVKWPGDRGERPRHVWLHRSNPYWMELCTRGVDSPECLPVPEEVSLETILQRVAAGRYGATVADTGLLASTGLGEVLQTVRVLGEHRPLTWFVRQDRTELKTAVDRFLFARSVLRRTASPPACRDLAEIRSKGVLRLVTSNAPTTCTVQHGGLSGFEYELVRRFARELGLRLELSIPPPGVSGKDWLAEGWGDLAAFHEPPTHREMSQFFLARDYRRVDLVVVCRDGALCPSWVEELAGLHVAATGAAAEAVEAFGLEPEPEIVSLPVGADSLAALSRLAKGRADVAVVDSDLARIQVGDWEGLTVGPVLVPSQPLAWTFNVTSPQLAARARSFLRQAARDGTIRVLIQAELDPRPRTRTARVPQIPTFALTPWDAELKRAALRYGIDWRLLASLMYEESRFDPRAVGPGGSAGLFQFMPATWQWLGVSDPFDPQEVIPAAARYLRMLMDEFQGLELADQVAMAIASYNVGPAHVMDARRLVREMALSQDVWRDNVETAMVILDDPEVARRFPAGVCRCRRAVVYTRRILRRYLLYTRMF